MGPIDAKTRALTALEPLELHLLPAEGLFFEEAVPAAWLRETLGATTDTGQAIEFPGDGRVELTVEPLGEVTERPPVRLHGRLEGGVRTPCVRCLEDVDVQIGDEIEVTLFPSAAAAPEGRGAKAKGAGSRRPKKGGEKAAPPAKAPAKPKGKKAKGKKAKGKKGGASDDATLEDWTGAEMPDVGELDDLGYVGDTVDVPTVLRDCVVLSMDLNPTCADEPACDARTQSLLDEVNRPAREAEGGPDPRWAGLAELMTPESEDS